MTISAGSRLGRYEVRSPLGKGGMGEVWLAYDHDLDREVAIKVLRDGPLEPDRHRRFVQEARAASALNHPNVATVYEIGSAGDLRFIAMEVVEGETLRARIARGALRPEEAVEVGLQIAAALAAAHGHGIIHRDIKPENIIIRPDGYAKVLDFGLAKLRETHDSATAVRTGTGVALGTIGYMAPEQFTSSDVTAAADVYSLGVVMHEMVHGRRPQSPGPHPAGMPPRLEAVINKALSTDAGQRYPSAVEMHEALRKIAVVAPRSSLSRRLAMIAAAAAIILALAGWYFIRVQRNEDAVALIDEAEQLVATRNWPAAYDNVMKAATIVPDDVRLPDLITRLTQKASIITDPPGATVWIRRFRGPATRVRMGTTPLEMPRLMRADYLVTVETKGHAQATRPLSIAPIWLRDFEFARMPGTLQIKMLEASKVPAKMVFVAGGPYRLQGWSRASDRSVDLGDFFIDRYEVSNSDYAAFVREGGYRRAELWNGQQADRFQDGTGLPGPRSWSGGAPAAGRENHPVTDVTWFEAAAYCRWRGKNLPTMYQWEKAGRYPGTRGPVTSFPWGFVPEGVDVTERANFLGKGTVPVDSMPFGMSTWGVEQMAGNVSEWVRNEKPPGHAARGGSWNDATYAFGQTASFPPSYASPTLGFRCVQDGSGPLGDFPLTKEGFAPVYRVVDDRTYEQLRARYDYERAPLNARVVETRDSADWRREKIAYDVAGKTVIAYLFVPRGYMPPFQVIHFAPAGDVESGLRSLAASIESKLAPHIRGGRAIFSVAMEGYIDRPRTSQTEAPDSRTSEYADYVIGRVTELRRGLDYLQTRGDIDSSRITFEADSAGIWAGVILCAVDNRYRSVMFVGSGVKSREVTDAPAANRINFMPRISAPKLMLQGRYDESTPYASEFEPLYKLLREPKRAHIYEGPHVPPQELYLRESQKWFDETMGKPGRDSPPR